VTGERNSRELVESSSTRTYQLPRYDGASFGSAAKEERKSRRGRPSGAAERLSPRMSTK